MWCVRLSRSRLPAALMVVGALIVLAASASPARAAKMYFGTREYLTLIQDVSIKGPNGEELYLGYKYSFYSFIMPYSVSDDGYILGVKGRQAYLHLDQAHIVAYQASGLLPSPLPPYRLSLLDYAMGHLLWIMPFVILAIYGFNELRRRRWRERRQRAYPHFVSGCQCDERGDLDQAISHYDKAIEIDPDFEVALVNRGASHGRRGDDERAVSDFTRAIKIGPKQATLQGLLNRAIAYQKIGYLDGAIADYTRVIKETNAAGAYVNRGNAFMSKDDYRKAVADYTKAIKLAPESAVAYQARSVAYAKQGNADLARADNATARRIAGESPVMAKAT